MNPKKNKEARRIRSTKYVEVEGKQVILSKINDPNFVSIVTKFKGYHQNK